MMPGYLPRQSEHATRAEKRLWLVAAGSAMLMLFFVLLEVGAFPALHGWDDKFTTVGPLMWIFAANMQLRAEQPQPDERFSPRALRRWAITYTVLGFVLTPFPLVADLLLEAAR